MSGGLLLAIGTGAVLGLGLFTMVLAFVGVPSRPAGTPRKQRASLQERTRRLIVGLAAGLLALLATGWIIAAISMGLLVAYWDRIAGSSAVEKRAIARLDALASWTESLRDTIAGAIGLEQAIPATAVNAGAPIRPSLNLLVDRLRIRESLPDALRAFAEDLKKYPKSPRAGDAMLKMGQALVAQGQTTNGCTALRAVTRKQYPDASPSTIDAALAARKSANCR